MTGDLGLLVQSTTGGYTLEKTKVGLGFYLFEVIAALYAFFNLFYSVVWTSIYGDIDFFMIRVSVISTNRTVGWAIASLGLWAPKSMRLNTLWFSTIVALSIEIGLLIYAVISIATTTLGASEFGIGIYVIAFAEFYGIVGGIYAAIYDINYISPAYFIIPAFWYALGFLLPIWLSVNYASELSSHTKTF